MKQYLRIRDSGRAYSAAEPGSDATLFGLDRREQNFARLRIA